MGIASEGKTKIKNAGSSANVHPEKVLDQHVEDGEEGQHCQHARNRREGCESCLDAHAGQQGSCERKEPEEPEVHECEEPKELEGRLLQGRQLTLGRRKVCICSTGKAGRRPAHLAVSFFSS